MRRGMRRTRLHYDDKITRELDSTFRWAIAAAVFSGVGALLRLIAHGHDLGWW